MSLNDGNLAFRESPFWSFSFSLGETKSRDGKVGILPLDFHFSSRSHPWLWECGNRALAISKDCGKRWKTCVWFSSFSIGRHFHSPLGRCCHAVCLCPKVPN